jgi:ferredoxin
MTEEVQEKKVEEIKKEAEALRCPVKRALYYTEEFLAGPMCGKCFPCEMGSYEAAVRLRNLVSGRGTDADLAALRRIAAEMLETSRCKKGKDTARFILDWMDTDAFSEHVAGRCPEKDCEALIEYRVVPEKCTMCGLCKEACRFNAIIGEKKVSYRSGYLPFEIRQRRCTKCGECIKACPEGAIIVVDVKAPAEVEA